MFDENSGTDHQSPVPDRNLIHACRIRIPASTQEPKTAMAEPGTDSVLKGAETHGYGNPSSIIYGAFP
jgi:hypothetical protein